MFTLNKIYIISTLTLSPCYYNCYKYCCTDRVKPRGSCRELHSITIKMIKLKPRGFDRKQ